MGGGAWPNAADKPPVSEFESPKLNIAWNRHGFLASTNDTGARLVKEIAKIVITKMEDRPKAMEEGESKSYPKLL